MSGWIKIHRGMLDNPAVCKDADHLAIWIHLLLNATHKPLDILIGSKRVTLQPGELATSRKSLSEKYKLSESKVERILNLFKIEQQIEQQSFSTNRVISVLNWHKYQESEQQSEQQSDSDRTAIGQQSDTNKKERTKELKNKRIKELKPKASFDAYTSNPELISSLESFIEFRKKIRKPMTEKAVTLLLKNLDELASTDQVKIAILEQSILNGWQSVYALKEQTNFNQGRQNNRNFSKPAMAVVKDTEPAPEIPPEEMERMLALARSLKERNGGNGSRGTDQAAGTGGRRS